MSFHSNNIDIYMNGNVAHLQVPDLFWGLLGWESGDVRLCRRPTSSEGDVGREDTGGVCARRVGTRVVVG